MSDKNSPDDFDSLFGDPEDPSNDPMVREAKEVQKCMAALRQKMVDGKAPSSVSNEDLFNYLRIVNFNFSALSRLVHSVFFKLSVLEEGVFELHKKINTLTEVDDLFKGALNPDEEKKG